jgi:hypothetical protein
VRDALRAKRARAKRNQPRRVLKPSRTVLGTVTVVAGRGERGSAPRAPERHVTSSSTTPHHQTVDPPAAAPKGPRCIQKTVTVSVVVPTYNRVPQLAHVLSALADQTYSRDLYEIVVVSDGSTDGTDDYLRSIAGPYLVVATQSNSGPAAARNHGVALASGSLVVFIDDDVVATPRLLERHVESHRSGGDGLVVIGPMLTPPDVELSAWVRWEQTMLYRQYDAMLEGLYAPTA